MINLQPVKQFLPVVDDCVRGYGQPIEPVIVGQTFMDRFRSNPLGVAAPEIRVRFARSDVIGGDLCNACISLMLSSIDTVSSL